MVAAQVIKCLWVASLAVAAPQLDFGAQRAVLTVAGPNNQQQIVSSVVSTLQPAIAKAVAAALRSSTTQSVSTRSKAATKASLNNYVEEENYGPAQYNYEYKVADKDEQTFITQKEERDGDSVTGKYSYVDPHGDLITVNYEAGPMGYTAFTDTKKGFVDVKARKSSNSKASSSTSSNSKAKASSSSRFSSSSSSSASSSVNQADLISRIISSLQPQIQSAVSSALSSSSRTTTTFVEEPRISAVSNGLEGTFGVGGNSVSIATPEFEIAY